MPAILSTEVLSYQRQMNTNKLSLTLLIKLDNGDQYVKQVSRNAPAQLITLEDQMLQNIGATRPPTSLS